MRPNIRILYIRIYRDVISHHGVLEPGTAFLRNRFHPTRSSRKVRELLTHSSNELVRAGVGFLFGVLPGGTRLPADPAASFRVFVHVRPAMNWCRFIWESVGVRELA